MSEEENFSSKNWMWVPDKEHVFAKAYIIEKLSDGKSKVKVVDEETLSDLREEIVDDNKIESCNPIKFNKCNDMAELTHLNEPSVVYNLYLRYTDDMIYTYSGLFLVAINPYNNLSIYNDHHLQMYHKASNLDDLKPHIFAITERTYQNLVINSKDQSILVTGESGAGKTENTKKIIQYISSISHTSDNVSSSNSNSSDIDTKILQANPILESFGNAQTIKNNNSSRFGKFIKIDVSSKGLIRGANIEYYLLEKSRVVKQSSDERNYHVFYQVLKGLPQKAIEKLEIVCDFSKYNYLKNSNFEIPKVDDTKEFKLLLNAFKIMGFAESDCDSIFMLIAVILHLGNLNFSSWKSEQASFSKDSPVDIIANLLEINKSKFTENFLKPKVKAGREFISKSKKPHEVKFAIDALAKNIYEKVFEFIVAKINENLELPNLNEGYSDPTNFIGVLDIAGFEIFKNNSFEQLCINYTNEKLQQFFNHHSFILEQREYLKENIQWEFIDFGHDLEPTINLIESRKPMGILAILDEECIVPKSSDKSFMEKLNKNWDGGSPKYQQNKIKSGFIINHYAGKVEYNIEDWLEKNRDPVNSNIIELLANSDNAFVKNIFKNDENLNVDDSSGRRRTARTVGQKHKTQLSSLMDQLSNTEPHFVRCILPNQAKKPRTFDKQLVLEQLRCNGVLEGIRIARAGFPNRIQFEDFFKRYSILYKNNSFSRNVKNNCELILKFIDLDKAIYKVGLTKLFFKNGVLAELEAMRDLKLSAIFSQLQAISKGNHTRKIMKKKILKIQSSQVIAKNFLAISQSSVNNPWFDLFIKIKPLLEDSAKMHETKLINDQLKTLEKEVKELSVYKSDVEAKNNTLEQELHSLEDVLSNERALLTEKDELLSQTKKNEIDLRKKLEESENTLTRLTKEYENLKEEKIKIDTDMNSHELKLNSQATVVESLTKTKTILDSKLAKLTKDLKELEDSKKTKESNLTQLEEEIKMLKSAVHSKDTKIKNLETKLEESSLELQSKLADVTEGCAAANKKVKDLLSDNKILERKIKEVEASSKNYENAILLKENEQKGLKEKISNQTLSISEMKKEKNQLERSYQSIQQELRDTKKQLDDLRAEYRQLQEDSQEAINSLKMKKQDEIKFNRGKQQFERELKDLQKQISTLSYELSISQGDNKDLLLKLNELKGEHDSLQKLKQDSDSKVSDLSKEVMRLKHASSGSVFARSINGKNGGLVDDYANIKLQLNEQSAILRKEKVENKKLNEEMYLLKTRLASEAYENRKLRHELNIGKRSTISDFGGLSGPINSSFIGDFNENIDYRRRKSLYSEEDNSDLYKKIGQLKMQLESEQQNTRRSELFTSELQADVRLLKSQTGTDVSEYQKKYEESQKKVHELEMLLNSLKDTNPSSPVFSSNSSSPVLTSSVLKENMQPNKYNRLSYDSKDLVKIYQDVSKTLKATRDELASSKGEVLRLKNLLRQSEDHVISIRSSGDGQFDEADLRQEISQLKMTLDSLETKNIDLVKSVKLYKTRAEDYYGKLEMAEVAIKTAARGEETAQSELEEVTNDLKLLKQESKASELVIRDLNMQVKNQEDQMSDKNFQLKKLQEQVNSLEQEIQFFRKKSMSGADDKYTQEFKAISKELHSKLQSETDLIKEHKKLELDLKDIKRERDFAERELANIEKQNARLESLSSDLMSKNRNLEKEKLLADRQIQDFHKQMKLLNETVQEITDERNTLNASKRSLEAKITDLSQKLHTYSALSSQAEIDLTVMRDHLGKQKQESDQIKEEFNLMKASSSNYENELQKAKSEAILVKEENRAISNLNKQLNDKIKSLENQIYDDKSNEFWESKVRELEIKLEESHNAVHENDKKSASLERTIKEMSIKLNNEKQLVKKYNDANFSYENKVNKLKSTIEILEQQSSESNLEIRKSEREVKELKENSLKLEKELLEWRHRFETLSTRKANLDIEPVFM